MADISFNKEALVVAHLINDAMVQPYANVGQRTSRIQIIVRKALQAAYEQGRRKGFAHGEISAIKFPRTDGM